MIQYNICIQLHFYADRINFIWVLFYNETMVCGGYSGVFIQITYHESFIRVPHLNKKKLDPYKITLISVCLPVSQDLYPQGWLKESTWASFPIIYKGLWSHKKKLTLLVQ